MNLNLIKYNRHWEKGFSYPYAKKRFLFDQLSERLYSKQILEITGLRRVGKSVLMSQLINLLIDTKKDPFKILYFTFDEAQPSIDELFANYNQQTNIDFKNEKIFVFLDEIQKLDNFQNQLKVYYDLYPNIKFIISGSVSLFIRKKTQESLAGRVLSFFVSPLDFSEYLYFKEKSQLLEKPQLFSNELETEFKIFLKSQFIESIFLKTAAEQKEYLERIIRKIVFEDLPTHFSIDYPQILWKICQFLAQKPGMIVNNLHLAQDLGISTKTLVSYLEYLENAFLIKKCVNFSKNFISTDKKLKKYYLSSPSFAASLVDFPDDSLLFENYPISIREFPYFLRDKYDHEIDFIFVSNNKEINPLEVKFTQKIKAEHYKNLLYFLEKNNLEIGTIAYMGVKKETIKIDKAKITLLPYFEI